MNQYRVQGLSIELIYTGEDKEYDVSYWSRLSYVKSMSRKELSVLVDIITEAIEKHYQRDRVDDINQTVEARDEYKQLTDQSKPSQTDNSSNLDDFLE